MPVTPKMTKPTRTRNAGTPNRSARAAQTPAMSLPLRGRTSSPRAMPSSCASAGPSVSPEPVLVHRTPLVRTTRSRSDGSSEERAHERRAGLLHARVLGADHLEEAQQVRAGGVALVAGRAAHHVDEAQERVLDVTADRVDVGR